MQSRRMTVLRAIVGDYIRSQEPVGSSSLAHHHDLGVSSATIRNDMAALEDEGYLVQPHTSAGRIPTEKGYRYFVDRLSTVVPLSSAQRRGIANFLRGSVSLQDTLRRAARLLADITGQVAVVASPSLSKSTLRHVEMVPVSAETLLAVVITDSGRVAQHLMRAEPMPDDGTLTGFCRAVNTEAAGLSLARAANRIRLVVGSDVRALAETLAGTLEDMAVDERESELYLAGTSRLAQQTSATDLAPLFDALEEQVVLMKLMNALSEERSDTGVGVAIGSETGATELRNASVVTSGYGHTLVASSRGDGTDRSHPLAFVGSIGPTHMDYAATIAAVRAVARYLTAFITPSDDKDAT
ncbi:heat-inducible transcriptional repressor HrcA [uncultured Bifidobacterium sp.]|uniref:heat-inducible transcriptional repressor HrcA n=1 Tax=uncultured Bifidobacterium sp. TaxID=165187 RepID=UPI0028DCB1CB|nr:heat-inducible transcriptional repressor HrcA [uncultured Bifidobacterium sp.]